MGSGLSKFSTRKFQVRPKPVSDETHQQTETRNPPRISSVTSAEAIASEREKLLRAPELMQYLTQQAFSVADKAIKLSQLECKKSGLNQPSAHIFEALSMKYEMKLLHRIAFSTFGRIPRSDDKVDFITLKELQSALRRLIFIVFISHRWYSTGEIAHPDKDGIKYENLTKNLEQLQGSLGEQIDIYIWIDFFGIDQDDFEQKKLGIASLASYIANSDCLITPYSDKIYSSEELEAEEFPGPIDHMFKSGWTKRYKSLSGGPYEYFGRAWCRLEMYLGSNSPLPLEGFNYFLSKGIGRKGRPHFLARDDGRLDSLPELSSNWLENLHPLSGVATDESDKQYIQATLDEIPTHKIPRSGYTGQTQDGLFHGIGTFIFEDGKRYEGEWYNNKMHGLGVLHLQDGSKYVGEFCDNMYVSNKGVLYHADGKIYIGGFSDNMSSGLGTCFWPNGDIFHGETREDMAWGHACLYYANGDKYEGEWRSDQKHGRGIFIHANGDIFEGEWVKGRRTGSGKIRYSNGEIREASWVDDHIVVL